MLGFSKHSLQSEFTHTAYVVLTDERHEIRVCVCSECFPVLQVSTLVMTLVLQYVSGELYCPTVLGTCLEFTVSLSTTQLAVLASVSVRVCTLVRHEYSRQ